MFFQKSVETQCRYCCHTNEDRKTREKRIKFPLQTRILLSEDHDDDNYGGQANHDGKAGTEEDERDSCEWAH